MHVDFPEILKYWLSNVYVIEQINGGKIDEIMFLCNSNKQLFTSIRKCTTI